jgi:hypothetical protein
MSDDDLKRAFAAALLKNEPDAEGRFKAALTVTPDTGQALYMANRWPSDPVVIDEIAALTKDGDDDLSFIGTKAEFAREVLTAGRASYDGDTKHKFFKLYAEMRGFISKPDTNVNVQVNQNRVMIVKDMGTDAEWEAKAATQQRALINAATSRH